MLFRSDCIILTIHCLLVCKDMHLCDDDHTSVSFVLRQIIMMHQFFPICFYGLCQFDSGLAFNVFGDGYISARMLSLIDVEW